MNSSSSGRGLEGFLSGKGFYIVLFLCAAVIGVSAWMMAAGNETMSNEALQTSVSSKEERRVETVIIPARPHKESPLEPELEAEAPAVSDEGPAEAAAPVHNMDSTPVEAAAPVFSWPLSAAPWCRPPAPGPWKVCAGMICSAPSSLFCTQTASAAFTPIWRTPLL